MYGVYKHKQSLIKPKFKAYEFYEVLLTGLQIPEIPMLWCQTGIATHCKTVAVMVSYDSILQCHVCELCGDEVCREFFGEPNSSPHEVSGS